MPRRYMTLQRHILEGEKGTHMPRVNYQLSFPTFH